jgi:quercetin dioxygenase-like cupin family protein
VSIQIDKDRFDWVDTPTGQRATLLRGRVPTVDELDVGAVRLNPGQVWQAPADGPEQVVVVTRGQLEASIRGETRTAPAWSLVFLALGEPRRLANAGAELAEFYVLAFTTAETARPAYEPYPSRVIAWDDIVGEPQPVTEHDPVVWYRERRVFVPAVSTASSPRLYAHVTTIDPGSIETYHPTHPYPCLYVGVSGTLRCREDDGSVFDINGPGGFYYLAEGAGHYQAPVGDESARYFVIQISTSRTPPSSH